MSPPGGEVARLRGMKGGYTLPRVPAEHVVAESEPAAQPPQYTPGAGLAHLQNRMATHGHWERFTGGSPVNPLEHPQLEHWGGGEKDDNHGHNGQFKLQTPPSPLGSTRSSHHSDMGGHSGQSGRCTPPVPGLLTPQQVDAARVLATQHQELSSQLVAGLRQEMVDAAYEEIMWELTPPSVKFGGGRWSLGDLGPEVRQRASEAIQAKVAHGTMALQATIDFARALQQHWQS